ncbi:hypothetical protein BC628DRAFT_166483 [Trametes gibbosa]|nr:hypothetical protein BC628DRAFT_166483 [Trametes gibbosa]
MKTRLKGNSGVCLAAWTVWKMSKGLSRAYACQGPAAGPAVRGRPRPVDLSDSASGSTPLLFAARMSYASVGWTYQASIRLAKRLVVRAVNDTWLTGHCCRTRAPSQTRDLMMTYATVLRTNQARRRLAVSRSSTGMRDGMAPVLILTKKQCGETGLSFSFACKALTRTHIARGRPSLVVCGTGVSSPERTLSRFERNDNVAGVLRASK